MRIDETKDYAVVGLIALSSYVPAELAKHDLVTAVGSVLHVGNVGCVSDGRHCQLASLYDPDADQVLTAWIVDSDE